MTLEELHRIWQRDWHDLFDADANLSATADYDRPNPLPADINADFRLIFGLSQATPQTRARCFALFPMGGDMHRRFESYMASSPAPLPESAARAALVDIEQLITALGPNEDVDFSKVTVIDRDIREGLEALQYTDDIKILLEGTPSDPFSQTDTTILAAGIFLTEPLYAAAGNYYDLGDWVKGVMSGGTLDVFYTQIYELWLGGWQVRLGTDGIILAKRTV